MMADNNRPAEPAPVEGMSFEAALKELEQIVSKLERGEVPLAESIEIYERGDALRKHCEELLKQADARVEKIRIGASGKAEGSEPLDVE
jgi:exodeoxyribonuclease VII small subunit